MHQPTLLPQQPASSIADWLASLPEEQRRVELHAAFPTEEARARARYSWSFWGRDEQQYPPGDWITWLLLAGRGFGKSRTGAEAVLKKVEKGEWKRVALVARTSADVRDVLIEGESGILSVAPPWNRPVYNPGKRRLTWPNGAIATTYSAEQPKQLRGPQHDGAWADELSAWQYEDAWDQLLFGLRLGDRPQVVVTTTPRPTKLIQQLAADPTTYLTRGSTAANQHNLAPTFLSRVVKRFQGTRLGEQELEGKILEDAPGALWKRTKIDDLRVRRHEVPQLVRVVIAVDPAVTSGEDSAETGIVALGISADKHIFVLEDASGHHHALDWPGIVVRQYEKWKADVVVAEVNNGGDLVETTIQAVDPNITVHKVHASRGKATRAEPVGQLYELRRVHHVGTLADLEGQMCSWEPGSGMPSPDRMDALVWGVYELALEDVSEIGFTVSR